MRAKLHYYFNYKEVSKKEFMEQLENHCLEPVYKISDELGYITIPNYKKVKIIYRKLYNKPNLTYIACCGNSNKSASFKIEREERGN